MNILLSINPFYNQEARNNLWLYVVSKCSVISSLIVGNSSVTRPHTHLHRICTLYSFVDGWVFEMMFSACFLITSYNQSWLRMTLFRLSCFHCKSKGQIKTLHTNNLTGCGCRFANAYLDYSSMWHVTVFRSAVWGEGLLAIVCVFTSGNFSELCTP